MYVYTYICVCIYKYIIIQSYIYISQKKNIYIWAYPARPIRLAIILPYKPIQVWAYGRANADILKPQLGPKIC